MVKVQYAGFGFNLKGIGPVLRVGVQFVGSGFSLKGRCSKKSSKESPTSLVVKNNCYGNYQVQFSLQSSLKNK